VDSEPRDRLLRRRSEPLPSAHRITAGPSTDLFIDPDTGERNLNAPRLLVPVRGSFQFSARVRAQFAATFDAGVLLVWIDEETWGKLCFERSPQGDPMVVSVVTRGVSDDANGFTVDGDTVWLRISHNGTTYAFHASTDGTRWQLIRHFRLSTTPSEMLIGFEAQSPTGVGCSADFDQVRFIPTALAELRDGT
jgi:regulation of enolase protein 1 (concanavalin A-like superfamily)